MVIQSGRVWIDGGFVPAQLVMEDGVIRQLCPPDVHKVDADWGDRRIVSGFIDVHTHGAYGFDTNDAQPAGLRDWVRRIPEEGVTGILPTTVTQMPDVLTAALANVAKVVDEGYEGAEILGVHFEGPYLDMDYKGAQPTEAIAAPSVEQFKRYQAVAKGLIRYITLAPEHDTDFALTHYCRDNGVVVSIGHSAASYEQGLQAVAEGAKSMTHIYNGMTPLHHRKPGLVGLALTQSDLYGEIIADGCHSHLAAAQLFYRCKNADKAIMVTDSLRVKYCPPGGSYQLGGYDIEVGQDGLARLKGTDIIAGSTLPMNRGLQRMEQAGVPFHKALASCTINPAVCLGLAKRKGSLVAGKDADIVVLEDDYSVAQTYCRGKEML